MSDDGWPDNDFLISFLEELTGLQVVSNNSGSKFKIYQKYRDIGPRDFYAVNPFAAIRFYEHDGGESMVVSLGGRGLHFDFADKGWLDCFNEFWDEEIKKEEQRIKRRFDETIRNKDWYVA